MVDLIDCYQYKDDQVDDVDAFKREPYILYFKTHNTGQSLPYTEDYGTWFSQNKELVLYVYMLVSCWDISSMYESFLTVDLFVE